MRYDVVTAVRRSFCQDWIHPTCRVQVILISHCLDSPSCQVQMLKDPARKARLHRHLLIMPKQPRVSSGRYVATADVLLPCKM